MKLRAATYNIEWFNDFFNPDNTMKMTSEALEKFEAVKNVLLMVKADLITILEAPNTTTTTGDQCTIKKLENFASFAGLSTNKAAIGFKSAGKQEIAILYNPDKMTVTHAPGGDPRTKSNPPFNGEFFNDTDDDNIKEVYTHYRPPFEARVELNNGKEFFVLGVHTKSKGIFGSVDLVHLERESRRNRLKIFAECTWIRRRVEDWLKEGKMFLVMGDINDGPGMDVHEMKYGKSGVELIMGDIFKPDMILRNLAGRPKWTRYGWKPASTRFRDRITETKIGVLIDHILAAPTIKPHSRDAHIIWNPYERDEIRSHKLDFFTASDHYPVSLDIEV